MVCPQWTSYCNKLLRLMWAGALPDVITWSASMYCQYLVALRFNHITFHAHLIRGHSIFEQPKFGLPLNSQQHLPFSYFSRFRILRMAKREIDFKKIVLKVTNRVYANEVDGATSRSDVFAVLCHVVTRLKSKNPPIMQQ
ncbi:hypothetical protein OUZ56_002642 [Daphnia magna]|uniref:Uncharacterized protein n=1 Tax=Daphnia magna TaxID=35525 RepID=A0ABR0A6B4_9CRUS|nr:hypothetical protein OUZ56_002642 [Daphnia magna]